MKIFQIGRGIGMSGGVSLCAYELQRYFNQLGINNNVLASFGCVQGKIRYIGRFCGILRPVLGTLHSGIPEAVRDGENGFLVPERNVDALADRLILLLKSRGLRQKMGETGRILVKDEFNIKKQTKKLEQIYSNVLLREFG